VSEHNKTVSGRGRAGQGRAGQGRAGQGRAEQGRISIVSKLQRNKDPLEVCPDGTHVSSELPK